MTALFGLAMAWYGTLLTIGTWDAPIPVLGLPGGFDYLPLVVGGVLIAIFAAERFALRLVGAPPASAPEGALPIREVI
jgi:TRAP-type C4-dicarboxylate transport system permease small subunit